MKNIEASVGAVPTQEKKEEVEDVGMEEYIQHENKMYFYLSGRPEYRIYAVGRWCENLKGDLIGVADTYFCHIRTGHRCESAWGCLEGLWCVGYDEGDENWKTLCRRIEEYGSIEDSICYEKNVGL